MIFCLGECAMKVEKIGKKYRNWKRPKINSVIVCHTGNQIIGSVMDELLHMEVINDAIRSDEVTTLKKGKFTDDARACYYELLSLTLVYKV